MKELLKINGLDDVLVNLEDKIRVNEVFNLLKLCINHKDKININYIFKILSELYQEDLNEGQKMKF